MLEGNIYLNLDIERGNWNGKKTQTQHLAGSKKVKKKLSQKKYKEQIILIKSLRLYLHVYHFPFFPPPMHSYSNITKLYVLV